MAVVKNLMVRCGADFSALTKGTQQAKTAMSGMQRSVAKSTGAMTASINTLKASMASLGVVFGTVAVVQFGKDCVKAASDLQEVQNVVDVTFGKMSGQVNDFAQNAIESFGLSEYSAKKYASTMGAMLKSSGIRDGVADLSISITQLTADMASFYNLNTDDAFQKIQAGISGETEPLKRLGINMSVANLEAYALSQGITKSWKAMTQAEQVMLRYNYLLETTGDAQGDFARTSGSWANQTKVLSMRFQELKTQLGEGLINALTPALRMLNSMVAALTNVATYWNALTAAIFGKQEAVASASADSASAAADAENDYADAVTAAGKAAKSNLASFDKLNVLQKDSGAGGASAMSMPEVSGIGGKGEGEGKDNLAGKISELRDKLSKIDFSNTTDALKRLRDAVSPFAQGVWEGLKLLFDSVLVPLANLTINTAIPAAITALATAFTILTIALNNVKPIVIGVFSAFALWKTIQFANYVMYIGALTRTTGWAALKNAISQAVFVGFAPLKKAILSSVAAAKVQMLTIGGQIKNFALLLAALAKQSIAWAAYKVKLVAGAVAQAAMTAATIAWNAVCAAAAAVTTAFGAAVAFLTSPIGLVVIAVGALIAAIVLLVKNWEAVKEVAGIVWDWICEKWSGFAEWFTATIIEPVSVGFKSFVNGLIGMVEAFVNFFVRGINRVISAVNRMSFSIPDWVPGIGGESFGLNISHIAEMSLPRLAKGGIANGATLAQIGEAGKEAVLPLENNTGWMDELAKRIGGNVTINASGSAGLMKYLRLELDKESTRRGMKLVKGSVN